VGPNLVPYHGSYSILAYDYWSLPWMVRLAILEIAALTGLLLAGCAGGSFDRTGLSLPSADGVQTVSDAADAAGHRPSASDSAKAAIAVTDALGSFVRDISADQHGSIHGSRRMLSSIRHYTIERYGKRIVAGSALVMRSGSGSYCQSSAGYSVNGIPSLDATFGWESGAFDGGSKSAGPRGSAMWSANAQGAVILGTIGTLSIARSAAPATCPMTAPSFVLKGGSLENAFSLPTSMEFRHGQLVDLSVVNGRFASGAGLEVTTARQPFEIRGRISNGGMQLATFRTNAAGDGTLTVVSTGAQYVIADWIVIGT